MKHFKQVFAVYGKLIDCFEEALYEELLDYIAYRNSSVTEEQLDDQQHQQEEPALSSPSMLDALATTPERFANVKKLLRIAATLPLTSCSAKRCFSAMKILKSRLRSIMDDEHLRGLAFMYIHKDKEISIDSVIDKFALSNRKLDFVL